MLGDVQTVKKFIKFKTPLLVKYAPANPDAGLSVLTDNKLILSLRSLWHNAPDAVKPKVWGFFKLHYYDT